VKEMKKYYVTMTDKFFSSMANETSKLVIECDTYQEAEVVAENAKHRTDMKNVNIRNSKPTYKTKTDFHSKATYPNWFEKDYFKTEEE
jgi:hypothetical protein